MCDHKETYIGKTVGDNVVGALAAGSVSTLLIVEQVFPFVNFSSTYIIVP